MIMAYEEHFSSQTQIEDHQVNAEDEMKSIGDYEDNDAEGKGGEDAAGDDAEGGDEDRIPLFGFQSWGH